MKVVYFSVLVTCIALFTGTTYAQDKSPGDVVIHSDARLAILVRETYNYINPIITTEPPKPAETTPVNNPPALPSFMLHEKKIIYSGKGFRVQIYNGPDREKALAVKAQFMRRFPGVTTYLMYIAPGFRVKIGDFRYRNEAENMLREANTIYKPSMIVPDMVTVSTY